MTQIEGARQEAPVVAPRARGRELRDLAALFLRLGVTAFGGPAAHLAMMEDEVVGRRRWLTHEAFLDLLGATNLIPGPNSTEMAIHIGRERAGVPGLVVAGVAFILPAALITGALAWAYVTWGALPAAEGLLYGVQPVVIAIVAQALVGLAPKAVKGRLFAALGALALTASLLGVDEIAVLVAAGAIAAVFRRRGSDRGRAAGGPTAAAAAAASATATATVAATVTAAAGAPAAAAAATATATAAAATATAATAPPTLLALFLFFLKIGSVLYGSGYVLLAFLRGGLVEERGWLSERALLDAVAAGQVTPGPVLTTATFVGYLLAGAPGAAIATLGIFLPGFVLVAATGALVPRLRRSPTFGAVLDGVNVASLALMAAVAWALARVAVVDLPTAALAALSALLLVRYRVSSTLLIAGGAVTGLVAARLARAW